MLPIMRTEMARHALFFLIVMLHLSAEPVSIDTAPKILTDNGDIIFQTATSKSIRFETQTGGQIRLNNMDLGVLSNEIQSVKGAIGRIEDLRKCNCELINSNIATNVKNIQDLNSELRNAKDQLASLVTSVAQVQEKLSIDDCANNPCHHGGTCVDGYNSFKCICTENYKGVNCNEDVDECTQLAGTDIGCQNNARCENFLGGFRCVCVGKWSGILCNIPLNGCSGSSNTQLCGHGTCVPDHSTSSPDSFKCICDSGWSLDPYTKTCINDIDECQVGKYHCSTNPLVACVNLPGHFTCDPCPQGFEGNGYRCTDINECATANICRLNEECINSFGSYKCQCIEGMRRGASGACERENICEINNGGCNVNAQCTMNRFRAEGRTCTCNRGYAGNGEGPNGCRWITPSNSTNTAYRRCVRRQLCRNGGRCQATRDSFVCRCAPGFTGSRCRASVRNRCSRNPCLNGARCEYLPPTHYRCHCRPFFTGVNCQNEHAECGGNFISPSEEKNITMMISHTAASVRSFRFPCIWTVFANREQFIQIIPTSMQLSGPCSDEYVVIEEKSSLGTDTQVLGRYCQESNSSPRTYNSSGSVVIIKAVLRHGIPQMHGFQMKIIPRDFTPQNFNCCHCAMYKSIITNLTTGLFQSPHYPLKYPLYHYCTMEFVRTYGERYKVELQIHVLDLGDRIRNCESTDYLKIIFVDKGEIKITACNQERFQNQRYITSGFKIEFRSDSTADSTMSRFKLTWQKSAIQDNCGGIVPFILKGTISVPSLSSENEEYCTYKVQHINSSRLILFKGSFNNWVRGDCSVSLQIKNINNFGQHLILWQTCQTQKMLDSFNDQADGDLIIIFKKSKGVSTLPFQITLEYMCGQSVDMDRFYEYEFQSSNYPDDYEPGLSCVYKFKAKTRRIAISFLDFDINDEDPCNNDYIKIKGSNSANLNKKFCNGNKGMLIPKISSNSQSDSLELLFKTNSTFFGRGFQAKVTVFECGGTYFIKHKLYVAYPEAYLNISTFHLSHEYQGRNNCTWEFYSAPGTYIFTIFDHFHLEYHKNCNYDYLTVIYDNQTKRFCGNEIKNIFTKSNKLKIQFISDHSVSGEGFKLRLYTSHIRTHCHEEIEASEGIIFSPEVGTLARPYLCYYRIAVPVGRKVLLNITIGGADTSRSGSPSQALCFGQTRLKIINGETGSTQITTLCLDNPQKDTIMTAYNVAVLVYMVPSYRSASEFNFTIAFSSIEEECGSILNDVYGEIASPNYPLFAPRNTYCVWKINSNPGRKVQIRLGHIRSGSVDQTNACNNKHSVIRMQTDTEEVDILCTDHAKYTYYFDDPTVKIIFSNQYNLQYRFRLAYKKLCTYTTNSMNGRIESNNLIFGFPSYCLWTLMPLRGSTVAIQIDEFDLPPPVNGVCTSFVEISDKKGKIMRKTCGDALLNRTFTSANLPVMVKHYINRRTPFNVLQAHKGLVFEYAAQGCVYNINYDPTDDATYHNLFQRAGTIESYQYPNSISNIDCSWTFKTIPGYSVKLTFDVIELDSFVNCTEGPILRAWEGKERKNEHVMEICVKNDPGKPFVFQSSTNSLYLKFMSANDSNGGHRKFHGKYAFVNKSCEYELKVSHGVITSPNYPNNYANNLRCKWHMKTREGMTIHLQFSDFDVEGHGQCRHDYVEVLAPFMGDLIGLPKMCGKKENISNAIYQSINNEIVIKFHTDSTVTAKGFKAKFFEGCGGIKIALNENQFMLSPNYPHAYSLEDGKCEWIIMANTSEPGLRIFFYFMGFEGLSNNAMDNCTLPSNDSVDNSLTIFNGYGEGASVMAVLCSNRPYHPIVSTSHFLKVVLKSSTGHAIFKASYGTGNTACGGEFYLNDGLITSPFYPNAVNMEIDCYYIIRNSPGSVIDLFIDEFSRLDANTYLLHDFIDIRNGSERTSPLVGRFYTSADIRNATKNAKFPNSVLLRLRSQGGQYTNDIKFLARYHINYITDFRADNGSFASPLYGHGYSQDTSMTWRIDTETSNTLDVSFDQFNVGRRLVDNDCSRGKLTITDSNNKDFILCGSLIPERKTYSAPITVSLTAEGYRYPGFLLRWSVPLNESHTKIGPCSYVIQATNEDQILTSPNFPNFDEVNRNCSWVLKTDIQNALEVKMLNFSLEHSVGCKYENFTTLFYGKRGYYYRFGQRVSKTFCGTPNISEFGFLDDYHFSRIKLDFKVDEYDLFPGFKLSYKTKCFRDIFESFEGWIQNDEYPNPMTQKKNCTYLLRLDGQRTFLLNFTALNLPEKTNGKCENGYLEISTFSSQKKYCGSQITSDLRPLLTNSHVVFINLVGDFQKYSPFSGFQLKYSLNEVEECGGSHVLSTSTDYLVITNPRNRSEYSPNYIECQWLIKSPYGTRLKIDLELALFMGDCTNNYLAFYDGSTQLARKIGDTTYCTKTNTLFASANTLLVLFKVHTGYVKFRIRVSLSQCGGNLYRSNGFISSPNYPLKYPKNSNCTWNIIVKINSGILVNLLDLVLGVNCSKSNLTIFAVEEGGDRSVWNSCVNVERTVHIMNRRAKIAFVSKSATTYKGFRLEYKAYRMSCGGSYNDLSRDLESLNYPASLPSFVSCTWRLNVDISRRIVLQIRKLSLVRGCIIIIRNKLSYVQHACNTNWENYEIDTESSSVIVRVRNYRGSSISFSYHSNLPSICGDHIRPDQNGTGVISIQNVTTCLYRIHNFPEAEGTIVLKVLAMRNVTCTESRVQISSKILTGVDDNIIDNVDWCGTSVAGNTFVTLGKEIDLLYGPSQILNTQRPNIQILYKYNRCGGLLTEPFGYIRSPGYPDTYPNYANCEWIIKAPNDKHIKLIVENLHLESHQTCSYDYLFIRYGSTFNSPPFMKYCGQHQVENDTLIFRNNQLRLSFHSDFSVTKDGFLIKYNFFDAVDNCNGILFDVSGSIMSPNYPQPHPSHLNCNWTVILPYGYQVKVTFPEPFDIERFYNGVCRYDYLTIYDSNPNNTIATLCGHVPPAKPILSSANRIGLVFVTDFNHNLAGFKAVYEPVCGGVFNESFGYFTSPNAFIYTSHYLKCSYLIPHWQNHLTVLYLTFNLRACNHQYGHVYIDFEDRFGNFYFNRIICGVSKRRITIFHTHSIRLRYNFTSHDVDIHAFTVNYLHDENIKYINNLTSYRYIKTPQFPSPYHHNADLMWKIDAPVGYQFYIKILSADIEPSNECNFDYLAIYNSNTTTPADRVGIICGKFEDRAPIKIETNLLTIHFVSDASHFANHSGFEALVQSTPGPSFGCGGIINVTSGVTGMLSSIDLNNDGQYDNDLHCEWTLSTSYGNAIQIRFENSSVQMEKRYKTRCTYDSLTIYDGLYPVNPIATLCGNDQVDPISSLRNNMLIVFETDSSVVRRGFKLTYTAIASQGHVALFATNSTQVLQSPQYPADSAYDLKFLAEIETSDENDHIIMEVTDLSVRPSANCSLDQLVIQDVSLKYSNKIRKICKPPVFPITFISSHNRVVVLYQIGPAESSNTIQRKRFSLNYQIFNCTRTEQAYSGSIINIERHKQKKYSDNQNCTLTLKAPDDNLKYQFYFKRFQLEVSSTCNYDYVQFIFGKANEQKYVLPKICGTSLPASFVSNSSQVSMIFATDLTISSDGFEITYVVSKDPLNRCGGDIDLDSGVVTSPGFGHNIYESGSCKWNIALVSDKVIKWKITDLQLGNSTTFDRSCENDLDFVKINTESSSWKYCGTNIGDLDYTLTTSRMSVEYKSANGGTGTGFRIEWDAVAY